MPPIISLMTSRRSNLSPTLLVTLAVCASLGCAADVTTGNRGLLGAGGRAQVQPERARHWLDRLAEAARQMRSGGRQLTPAAAAAPLTADGWQLDLHPEARFTHDSPQRPPRLLLADHQLNLPPPSA